MQTSAVQSTLYIFHIKTWYSNLKEQLFNIKGRIAMNVFLTIFIQSLQLPKQKAVFALNRIGMDITVVYMFILLAIASIPGLIEQIASNNDNMQVRTFFLLIFFFIFYYLVSVVMVFGALSGIAYIATLLAKFAGRKLRFGLLWKMTAFATTVPFVAFTILSFFLPLTNIFLTIATLFIFFLIIKIILIYPKRKLR